MLQKSYYGFGLEVDDGGCDGVLKGSAVDGNKELPILGLPSGLKLFLNAVINLLTSSSKEESVDWYTLAYNNYGDVKLWWVILVVNKIVNPFEVPQGTILKVLKPTIVSQLISGLTTK